MSNQNPLSRDPDKRYIPHWSVQNKTLFDKKKMGDFFISPNNSSYYGETSFNNKPFPRNLPRWSTENRVLFRLENDSIFKEALSKDITTSGACLYCQEEIKSSSKLTLLIYLTDDLAVEVGGTVLWNKNIASNNLIGVRFENTSPQVQEMILQYAFESKKDDLTRHWFKGWEYSQ